MKYVLSLLLAFCLSFSSFAKTNEIGENIDVIHYEIHLNTIDFTDRILEASAILTLTTKTEISALELELKSMEVTSVICDVCDVADFSQDGDILNITFASNIAADTEVKLTVNYGGNTFNENWGGVHWSNDYVYNLGVGFDSQPHNLGKTWFPCVDDFNDKASYDLYLNIPQEMTSSCGGLLVETTTNNDGTKTDHWTVSQEIPTYLISFAVGSFALWEDTYEGMERNIPINVYAKPNQIEKVAATFANTKEIAAFFEAKFGPFPFNRIAYVSTSLGCMEHVDNIALASSLITGTTNLDSEFFIAHEMAHSWFGNKVTCASAGDMWLNEGFATFCNNYYLSAIYGEEAFAEAISDLTDDIITSCHNSEGWIPLNDMPLDLTYGTTVYDKGAVVVNTMMNYLGRETFDEAIKYYLNKFSYKSASSEDLRDAVTESSGVDMNDFFDTWVFNAGSPVYTVQNFTVEPNGNKFDVEVMMNQGRRGADYIGNSVRYEITFVDEDWNTHSEMVSWDGETGVCPVTLDFEPVAVFCDYNKKFADASIEKTFVIKNTGSNNFSEAKFKATVQEISDSTLLRVEHHWDGPKTMQELPEGLTLSSNRYWTIHILDKGESKIQGEFQYQKNDNYDGDIMVNENDSIVLLYRPNGSEMWQSLNYVHQAQNNFGRMTVDNIKSGDYALGMWDEEHAAVKDMREEGCLEIFPNPAENKINIRLEQEVNDQIIITNQSGQVVKTVAINGKEATIEVEDLAAGVYNLKLRNSETQSFSRIVKL